MRFPSRNIRKTSKMPKGCVGESRAKPWICAWFLLDAGQNIPQKSLCLVAVAGLGLKIDVVGLLS